MKKWYVIASFLTLLSVAGIARADTGQTDFSQVSEVSTGGAQIQVLGTSTESTYSGQISRWTGILIDCLGTGTSANLTLTDLTASNNVRTENIPTVFASGTSNTITWNFAPYQFLTNHRYEVQLGIAGSSCVKTMGSATSSSWPFGDAVNGDTGLPPVPVYDQYFTTNFNLTGFTSPSTSTLVQIVWPQNGATVNSFWWWPIAITDPIPIATNTQQQNIVVRYSITAAGADPVYEADVLWKWDGKRDPNGIVWVLGNQAGYNFSTSSEITAQAAYIVQHNDLTPQEEYDSEIITFTVDRTLPQSTSTLGTLAQNRANPNQYSTSTPFVVGRPIFDYRKCGSYTIPFFGSFTDPFCDTANLLLSILNTIADTIRNIFGDIGASLPSLFPLNIYHHLLTDFAEPNSCTAAGAINITIGSAKTIHIYSSSSFTANMQAAGVSNYRQVIDYLIYALVGVIMLIWGIMAFAWASQNKQ